MKLGEKIYQLRRRMGLSQEELAERVGVTRQAVSKWEQGTSVPELETLVALAKTFDVSADYLLSDECGQYCDHGTGRGHGDWRYCFSGTAQKEKSLRYLTYTVKQSKAAGICKHSSVTRRGAFRAYRTAR